MEKPLGIIMAGWLCVHTLCRYKLPVIFSQISCCDPVGYWTASGRPTVTQSVLIRSDTNRRGINWFDVWSTQSGGKLSGSNSADVLPHFLRQSDLSRLRYTKVGTALVTAPFWPSREVQKYSNIAQGYNGREPTPASIEFPNTQSVAVIALTLCLQYLIITYRTLSAQ